MAFLITVTLMNTASANLGGGPYVRTGYAGYCVHKPTIGGMFFMKGGFEEVIFGPRKYGVTPLNIVCSMIDLRQQKRTESFDILAKDELVLSFNVHAILKIERESQAVRTLIVELGENWYDQSVREPFRTIVRKAAEVYESRQLVLNREKLGQDIQEEFKKFLSKYPIRLVSVEVGNIQYPQKMREAVERKMEKEQEIEKVKKEKEIARIEAERKVIEAKGQADAEVEKARGKAKAMEEVNKKITKEYIEFLRAQAMVEAAGSEGRNVIFMPQGASTDGIPTVYDISDEVNNK